MTTVVAPTITIDEAIARFEDNLKAQGYPPLTITTYLKDVRYWREWLRDNCIITKVSDLTREDITEYLAYLAKNGKGRPYILNGNGSPGVGPATLKKKLAGLRKFALFLVEAGYHEVNITEGIRSPRVPKKEPAFLNQ